MFFSECMVGSVGVEGLSVEGCGFGSGCLWSISCASALFAHIAKARGLS